MKFRITIILVIFSLVIHAQTEDNQVKIEKSELGIGRDLNFEFKVLEPGVYSKKAFPLITIYKLSEQTFGQNCNVIDKHGKGFDIKILTSCQFNRESVFYISKLTNPAPLRYFDYELNPEIRFAAREIIGYYPFDELNERKVEKEILDFLRKRLKSGIVISKLEIEVIKNN